MSIIQFSKGQPIPQTPHFSRYEFDCPCGRCSMTKHDTELSQRLETLRTLVGPLHVSSGYRCPSHNAAVGGSRNSMHVAGRAADIYGSLNPVALGIIAQAQGFRGVGIYWYGSTAFVHVDTRSIRATWLCVASRKYNYTSLRSFLLPTIRRGSSGPAVQMLQRLLGVSVDGVFGAGTERALKAAQEKAGITVDGICGSETWRRISGAYKFM